MSHQYYRTVISDLLAKGVIDHIVLIGSNVILPLCWKVICILIQYCCEQQFVDVYNSN
jgi:hypothetical protein